MFVWEKKVFAPKTVGVVYKWWQYPQQEIKKVTHIENISREFGSDRDIQGKKRIDLGSPRDFMKGQCLQIWDRDHILKGVRFKGFNFPSAYNNNPMESKKEKKRPKSSAGRWTKTEHDKFMKALEKYGRNWVAVQKFVKTRNLAQVRSHAQKAFLKMSKADIDALIAEDNDYELSTLQYSKDFGKRNSLQKDQEDLVSEPKQTHEPENLLEMLKKAIEECERQGEEKGIQTQLDREGQEEDDRSSHESRSGQKGGWHGEETSMQRRNGEHGENNEFVMIWGKQTLGSGSWPNYLPHFSLH